jgi:hypothetical protein
MSPLLLEQAEHERRIARKLPPGLHAVNWNCKFSFDFLFLHVNEIVVS